MLLARSAWASVAAIVLTAAGRHHCGIEPERRDAHRTSAARPRMPGWQRPASHHRDRGGGTSCRTPGPRRWVIASKRSAVLLALPTNLGEALLSLEAFQIRPPFTWVRAQSGRDASYRRISGLQGRSAEYIMSAVRGVVSAQLPCESCLFDYISHFLVPEQKTEL